MVKNIKELQKLIKMARKEGVESLRIGDLELKLGPAPHSEPVRTYYTSQIDPVTTYTPGGVSPDIKIVTDELTEEQLLMWSVDGAPVL